MTRRALPAPWVPVAIALTLVLSACGRLGIGDQSCEPHSRAPSVANVLAAQAVPTARYTPCFWSLDIGWDDIDFEAESGRAGIAIHRGDEPFLTAVVTESCDVGDAVKVETEHEDIDRYEDVEVVPGDITLTVVPDGPAELMHATALIAAWEGVKLDERRVVFVLNRAVSRPIGERLSAAFADGRFVWLIDALDLVEGTVEMRTVDGDAFSRMQVLDAFEEIEDQAPVARYQGNWYFTFDGGCITYTFDAEGLLAETVAADAESNLGFYPAFELWEIAAREGSIELGDEE